MIATPFIELKREAVHLLSMLSTDTLLILAALAGAWLSLRSDIRALTAELRQHTGDPALRDRDIQFEEALSRVKSVFAEPVSPRETLEAHRVSPS